MKNYIFCLVFVIFPIFFCFTPLNSNSIIKGPSPGGIYIYSSNPADGDLYYSPDYGETLYHKYVINGGIYTADESLGVVYYANTGVGLNCSFDYGSTWIQRISQEVTSLSAGVELGELYIWRTGLGILYSTDFGESFDTIGVGPAGRLTAGASPGELYASNWMETTIYFSSDYGETFCFINEIDSTYITPPSMQLASGPISGELYVLNPTGRKRLLFSTNFGETFEERYLHTVMDTTGCMDVAAGNISGEVFILRSYWDWEYGVIYIYYSTDYGESWIHNFHLVTDISEIYQTEAVNNCIINSPNPCNSHTVFKYSTNKNALISLAIYDIYGRRIKTLLNSQDLMLGEYDIFWDCKNEAGYSVSSGIYFSVLEIDNTTTANKVIILGSCTN